MSQSEPALALSHTNIPEIRKWRFCAQVLWPQQGPALSVIQDFLKTRLPQCLKDSPPQETVRAVSKHVGFQPAPSPYEGQVWQMEAHQRRKCVMSDEDASFGLDIEQMSFHLRSVDPQCLVLFTAAGTEQSFNSAGRRGYVGWHLPDALSEPHAKGHQNALWQHLGESSLHSSNATYEGFLSKGNARMPQACIRQTQQACFATATLKLVLPATLAWLREQHLQTVWTSNGDVCDADQRSRL